MYEYLVLSTVIGALVIYYLFNFNFFRKRDVIHIPSIPILGAMAPVIFRQISFVDFTRRIYNVNRDAKYIGLYVMRKPVLLLRDVDLIKKILKNFDIVTNCPVFDCFNEYVLTQNLFSLKTKKWQDIRYLLVPFFTAGKMKELFPLISQRAEDFAKFISTLSADESNVNMRDVFDRYTNDVIASCCFGLEFDSVRDPTNKFYNCGKEITHMSAIRTMKYMFVRTFPMLGRIFNIQLLNNQEMKYFEAIIRNEIAIRNAKQIDHTDIIQRLINNKNEPDKTQLDINDMVAQVYAVYFAGFETSSSVMSFIVHKLAANPNVQIRLRQEIDEALDNCNGDVTCEIINKLRYLSAVVKEGLRLFSPSIVERVCDKEFELPSALPGKKSLVVEKGMIIWVPLYAIHLDEKYYDDPEEFRPERFLDDNNTLFYHPFGLGRKKCMGEALGTLMVKTVLFYLLARCELKQYAKAKPFKFSTKNLIMMPENGFWINVQCRDDMH